MDLAYWAFFGTFYLILLTFQDFKRQMIVDDRHNYFMLGITVSLISHVHRSLLYIFALVLVVIALTIYLNKTKVLGEADNRTISWIFLGLGYINPFQLAWFGIFFILITALYVFIKFKILKYKKPLPFYPVLLLGFLVTAGIFKLYTQ